jgi:hypothetical protein
MWAQTEAETEASVEAEIEASVEAETEAEQGRYTSPYNAQMYNQPSRVSALVAYGNELIGSGPTNAPGNGYMQPVMRG